MAAEYVVLAEQYDTGKMTQAQYAAAESKTLSDYTTRALQRQNSAAMADAAARQADAAVAQAWAANKSVTCNRNGNSTTCY